MRKKTMQIIVGVIACLMAVLLLCSSMSALAVAPQTTSQSVCVMDADTGEILYEKDAYTQLPMASITKTMTALVAMENSDLQGTTTATNEALATVDLASTRIGFEAGENLTLDELMRDDPAESYQQEQEANMEGMAW